MKPTTAFPGRRRHKQEPPKAAPMPVPVAAPPKRPTLTLKRKRG
jgi:hypothetical protein